MLYRRTDLQCNMFKSFWLTQQRTRSLQRNLLFIQCFFLLAVRKIFVPWYLSISPKLMCGVVSTIHVQLLLIVPSLAIRNVLS